MLSPKMEAALNDQIQKEFASAYLYLSMAAYFDALGLKGFANWMRVQHREEEIHALAMFNYVAEAGGRVKLQGLPTPDVEFASPLAVFDQTVKHEQGVTASINSLVDLAIAEKDHATNAFLQWFVTEQVEEEASAKEIRDTLKLVGDAPQPLLMMDRELRARAFVAPSIATTYGVV